MDSESKMNLAALRKVDSSISSIVDIANQVAVYKFLSEANKWEKTEIEGTLFVYMRSQKPQHGFMVMNRLSTTNLVEPINESLDFKDQTPFLLYRNDKGCIYGVWFYEKSCCSKIFKLLTSLSQLTLNKNDTSSNTRQRSYSESHRKHQKQDKAKADILSLLTRAQDEYDKKSAKESSKDSNHSPNGDIVKPTPVRVNGTVNVASGVTPLTLGMLFAQAGGVERKPEESSNDFDTRTRSFTANSSNELSNDSGKSTEAIIQSLLSNSAHTVQHIERLQKEEHLKTDLNFMCSENRAVSANEHMFSVESVEKDLKEKLNILPKCDAESKPNNQGKSLQPNKSNPIDIPILTPAMLESSFSSAPSGMCGSIVDNTDINLLNTYDTTFPAIKECKSFSPNQLLSPMDFTVPCRKKTNMQTTIQPSSYSPDLSTTFMNDSFSQGNSNGHVDLLNPQTLINGVSGNQQLPVSGKPSVTPLNRDQLREALIYMLQNDEDFVTHLHDCYVKRLKSQLNFVNKS